MENIIIFGASGHGKVVADCIEKQGKFRIVGFVDSSRKRGLSHIGYPILGSEKDLPYIMSAYNIRGGVVAVGDNWSRKLFVDKINKIVPDFRFITVIHPSAVVGKNVCIGRGTVIMPGAIINAGSLIENHCFLNTKSSLGHDGIMGNFSSLASNVCTGGNLILGSFSAISLGCSVIENIEIGSHTVIGAGALVLKHIPSNVVAYGSPAETICERKIGQSYLGKNSHMAPMVPVIINR
ncbi:acetyltransferase [Maribacter sp. 2210JD10-5]|uniref:acetyltransferase n=1 Tax=Maribacter sp. 2210JD10-5 TaxID=3386272 RepID=UPI0039BC9E69